MLKLFDPDVVTGTIKPKNHQKTETCFDEIWSQWDKLHKSKTMPRVVVDSLNFMKLPMVRPGETRSEMSTERIAALERMVENLVEQNKGIVESLDTLKKKDTNPLSFARVVSATGTVPKFGPGVGGNGAQMGAGGPVGAGGQR